MISSGSTGAITLSRFHGTDAEHFQKELCADAVICGPGRRDKAMPNARVDIADQLDMVRICLLTMLGIWNEA